MLVLFSFVFASVAVFVVVGAKIIKYKSWFVSALIGVSQIPAYIKRVVPVDDQSFDKSDYAGIFVKIKNHFLLFIETSNKISLI